jgi:hypothetical protein
MTSPEKKIAIHALEPILRIHLQLPTAPAVSRLLRFLNRRKYFSFQITLGFSYVMMYILGTMLYFT